jgi:hypothetical protein
MLTYEDRQQKLRTALEQKWPHQEGQYEMGPWVRATMDDAAIVEHDGKMWRVPYMVTAEHDVVLGEPALVETVYEPVSESSRIAEAVDGADGRVWDVVVIEEGRSGNGFIWTRERLAELAPMLEGIAVGCYEFRDDTTRHAPVGALLETPGLARNVVGDLQQLRVTEGAHGKAEIRARLTLHDDAEWLRTKLTGLAKRGAAALKTLGLSVDTFAKSTPVQTGRLITKVVKALGVDVVTQPSAGGRFERAVAGPLPSTTIKEDHQVMNREELLTLIRESRPALFVGKDVTTLTDADLQGLVREAMKPPAAAAPPVPDAKPDWFKKYETAHLVRERLAVCKLPQPLQDKIANRFKDRVAEAAEIDAVITEERDVLARISESGEVQLSGRSRAAVTVDSIDKVQIAADRLFGVVPASSPVVVGLERVHEAYTAQTAARVREALAPAVQAHKDAGAGPRFHSLKEMYVQLTGDSELSFRWDPNAHRVSEAINSGTFANILSNTLYRRMLMEYAVQDYGERNIISVGRAEDFRTKDAVRMGYFGDIDSINPEAGDYQEKNPPTDEKVSYAVGSRGNLLTITRRMIINDDMRTVETAVRRFGRAGRRTFARFVWNFFINNAAYDVDGVAWFHADHANLQSAALTAAEISAAVLKLQNMTEPNSGEKLGLNFARGFENIGLWLAVPTALWDTARKENEREYLDANFTPNAVRYAFGRTSERVMVNPLFTDATDWGVFRDPADVESIVVDFLQGREEPELFLADAPTVGEMFKGDKIQYKYRHEFGGDVAEVRGAVKAVVAG